MFTPQALHEQLAHCAQAPVWWLGLSGGLDSMVLLEALTQLGKIHSLPPVVAIHVHHGLHPLADKWVEHCEQQCALRNISLHIKHVQLEPGASIEAAARNARYEAFASLIGPEDVLLLAHHLDDQLETLLFRLVRGTGLRGLTGMPPRRQLGSGQLFRPLLGWPRSELEVWAQQQALRWIDDPANTDARFARTTLRHQILPVLRQHWPMVDASLMRLVEHVAEANSLLDERAAEDLERAQLCAADPWLQPWSALQLDVLLSLSPARQNNLLRYWLQLHGKRTPDHRQSAAVLDQLGAADDSQPVVQIDDYQLRRSAGHLWQQPITGVAAGVSQPLAAFGDTLLAGGNGVLCMRQAQGGISYRPGNWHIGYRQGGERLKLTGRPHRSLKQLFQEAGIPAWLRPAVPLLFCDGELVSVAGRWNAEAFSVNDDQSGWRLEWQPAAQVSLP
ncbi:tRNA lysidine(34) synthetase TilS [Pseudomonas saliphila]|uniref:tRNA lysidine(34) synthetase TilS n=1 Tax=Pseudomonas saliphila TaxID=2586906 RepID=UPI00123C03F5|nr:tRNA lysidine(34) synthetase TilS [Pseudomonas saliphila]